MKNIKNILLFFIILCLSATACGSKDAVVQKMIDDIDAIGEVTVEDEERINQLYERYNTLTDKQKSQVTNYIDLLNAIDQMDSVKQDHAIAVQEEIQNRAEYDALVEKASPIIHKINEAKNLKNEHYLVHYEHSSYRIIQYDGEGTVHDEMFYNWYDTSNGDIINTDNMAHIDKIHFEDYIKNGYDNEKFKGSSIYPEGRVLYDTSGEAVEFTIKIDSKDLK